MKTLSSKWPWLAATALLLVYTRPANGPLRFDAAFLKKLPADHRTALTLKDADDKVLRTEVLRVGEY